VFYNRQRRRSTIRYAAPPAFRGVAMLTALRHPEVVGRLVAVSANIRRSAIYPEMLAQQGQVGPDAVEFMKDTPMYQLYQRGAPAVEDGLYLVPKVIE